MDTISKIKIVFLGAGLFAPPVLNALLKDPELEVVLVVTQPDRPAGRKAVLTPSPLGQWCIQNGVVFERIENVNSAELLDKLQTLQVDMAVVVSFGQLLKEDLLNLPRLGCLNVHASLLPKYRGASPIISAILNGEPESGVCFMRMDKGLDTGPVYQCLQMTLDDRITAPELEQRLAELAGQHIGDCIRAIAAGKMTPVEQDPALATISRKIRKAHASLNWNSEAAVLDRMIRAFNPWPSVVFSSPGSKRPMLVKITAGQIMDTTTADKQPGTIISIQKDGIAVACGIGVLLLTRVIPEGRKEMSAADFARGFHLEPGMIFANGPETVKG